jgi:holo-[acyl-carrier protein] synthase
MIAGIGTDLVDVERMKGVLQRHPELAARRILTVAERVDFGASADPARFLAKRFAVKEAFAKALGTGIRAPVLLTSIGVGHDEAGRPLLVLSSELAAYVAARGIGACHVSISDERTHALAFVVVERNDD